MSIPLEQPTETRHIPRLRTQIGTLTVARMAINTSHRMIYPFLPRIARGLGVEQEAIAMAVTARSGLGVIGPAFGSLADRYGRKVTMLTGLLMLTGGMALVAGWPSYPTLFIALMLAGAAKLIYDPAMQAYIGDRVRYTRRGLALAFTELSWSGAFLISIPLIGWLIDRSGRWYAPFPWLAGMSLLAAVVLWRIIPSDGTHQAGARPSLTQGLRTVMAHRPALAGLAVGFLIMAGNETVFIVYGGWMEDSFALKVAELGLASTVIGFAELSAEGLVAGVVDRLGKRRAAGLGIGLNALACLLLPVLGFSIVGALIGLFVFFITFEFAVVSAIPLMTELVPGARATLMAGNMAAFSVGRMLGALIGPLLFGLGLLANGIAAAIFDVIALAALLLFVHQE